MDLATFDLELRALADGDERVRPFVCNGSPLECRIFIVGTNPATEVPFWPYWDRSYGFRKQEWLLAYEKTRVNSGKRKRSPTRRVLEQIVDAAEPIRCLETNVYSRASVRAAELGAGERLTEVFSFLLSEIRPRIVHVHGEEARDHFHDSYGARLEPGSSSMVDTGIGRVEVLATHHLAYQWSYARAAETGRWLASRCGDA